MIAANRAGELAGFDQPDQWSAVDWLLCDCGGTIVTPRNQQGHVGKWALCSLKSCRKLWELTATGADVTGSLDGVLPERFHERIVSQ